MRSEHRDCSAASEVSAPPSRKHGEGMTRLMDKIRHDLIYLHYGIYGAMLYLGHAEFCPSAV